MSEAAPVKTTRLPGGMRVVTHEMPHLESVSLGVWVGAGARHETSEQHGIAHVLEHMAFKGTERRTALQIAEELESVGGDLNAATSAESTAYYARVLKDDVPRAMDVLADILQNPIFDIEELERERSVIIQEIAAAQDAPDDSVFDYLQETAFPDQPLGRPILGTVDTVTGFSPDDLTIYRDANYAPSSMIVAAAGAVSHDRLVELAQESYRVNETRPAVEVQPARYSGGDRRKIRDLEQAHVVLGFEALSYVEDDFYAMQVLSSVLGGGMSSRLFQEVRENRGLCYSIFSFAWGYADSGLFGVYAGTGADDLPELIPVVADELTRITGDAGEQEVDRARAQLKAGLLMSLESSSARAEQIARQELVFGRVLPISELIDRVDAVDAARVRALAERLFQHAAPVVAAVGPVEKLAPYEEIAQRFV